MKLEVLPDTGRIYSIYERMGSVNFRSPSYMTFDEASRLQNQAILKDYWKSRSRALDGESAVSSRNLLPKLYVSPILDRIFGGSYVELIPRGFVTLDFGGQWQKIQNPSIPIRQQTNGGFEFDQQINLAVTGKVGEKLKITTNFDNNNSFDFQNQMKIEYTGFKEDILKKLEIGNVSLPLNNSLIQGAQNLFGLKAQLQFGKLFVTSIATTQRGKQSTINIAGSTNGASQGNPFVIVGSQYDENRHFFLGQFFRDNFQKWLSTLPQSNSGINITRVEVYLLNRSNDTQTLRDVIGLMDLGENDKAYRPTTYYGGSGFPAPTSNETNTLLSQVQNLPSLESDVINGELETHFPGPFINGTDFEKITSSRKLAPTEFTYHKELGYITLQRKLQNDEALAVAYEYTYQGQSYKVGELTEDYSNRKESEVVFLKLLRPRKIAVKDDFGKILPTWNLMMKNIYSLGVTQIQKEGFQLRVIYRDDATGKDNPQLQDGDYSKTVQLIQAFGLDRLNPYNDPQPDGNFDFVEKATINSETGLIIFPLLEPFNDGLKKLFASETPNTQQFLLQKYLYDTLYHTTRTEAELVTTKNKFFITGSVRAGAGKDIIIQGFNISQGSVKVFAGGAPLREGVDFQVDYTFGKVTILNEGILSSGKDISITYEQQDPFAFQTRSLLGTRFDYKLNDDVNLGSTFLYYNERPLISRNLIGTEPARNIQYGLDLNLKKNSRILTKVVDALPFLQTKEISTVTLNAEFAQLLPGTSNIVQGDGTSFIDDFENTATPYSLMNPVAWKYAVVPQTIDNRYDQSGGFTNDVRAGFRRAKLAWYQIDNLFYRESSTFKPSNIGTKEIENHYVRPVIPQEIFPFKDAFVGNFYEQLFDVAYYPSERGVYNYNPDLNPNGTLKNPELNWAGITTAIRTEVDFDKANVEYVEFWLMDPFINNANGVVADGSPDAKPNTTGGKLIFHMGSISEDLMKDGKHAFENGLPTTGVNIQNPDLSAVTPNNWGFVTNQQFINNAFNTDVASRANQDVGLDGIGSVKEQDYFNDTFLSQIPGGAPASVQSDPSADDFEYFLGPDQDARNATLLGRYKNINGLENNSPIITGSDPFAQSGSTIPENEDLNQDNTLSDLEEYYVFNLDLKPGQLEVGKKYIVDKITPNNYSDVTWYLVRIPIRQFEDKVGGINGFKSIRYARMILTGFTQPVVLRFASFRAVGNRWRRYEATLDQSQLSEKLEPNLDNFSVSVVNVEENGQGNSEKPSYVPPIARDRDVTSTIQRRLNEQSVQMCVTNLEDGDGRAIYKTVGFDFFNYGRIKMFLSAHNPSGKTIQYGQLTAFLRLGTDDNLNYYEIELPLKITANGATQIVDDVWPIENQIDLDLNELYALKAQRDRENFSLQELYPRIGPKLSSDGRQGIRIFGRPDLSQVKVMMIGVRNLRDDGRPVDVCIWADEMRLTDFDRTAGWAANAVLNTKLADLGNITTSFKKITFGYGGVQSKISERARGETNIFDISASIAVDKLLPRNTGLKIPMFISYEKTTIDPNYDPANPDTRIEAMDKSFNTEAERIAYHKIIQDNAVRKSLNFTNVRKTKVKTDARSNLYDIENFSFTYAFSEATRTNFNLQENTQRNIKGAIAWQFNPKFKGFEPFKNSEFKSQWLQLIKDFNFNPVPTSISVRGELDRSYNKIIYRNATVTEGTTLPNIQKYFLFNRYYTARWAISKALTIDYNSRVNAIIDEPDVDIIGGVSPILKRNISADQYRDSVLTNLKSFGRKKNFEQNITANYTVPFDKFPLTNWVGAEYRYNVGYSWRAGPIERVDSLKLGNIIQNTVDQGLNGRIDLVKLYNKSSYLKDINTPKRPQTAVEKARMRADTVKRPPNNYAVKGLLRLLMSMRSITATYNINAGTILPGFTPTPNILGMDNAWAAPGWGFILGSQDGNIRKVAAKNHWLTRSPVLTTPFSQNETRDLGIRTSLELTQDFKVQLDVKKTTTSSFQEIYRHDPTNTTATPDEFEFSELSPTRTGSYRISTISVGTSFMNNTSLNSDVFNQFVQNRAVIQSRFFSPENYKSQSQDVLIPAFISAYTGTSAQTISLSPFPSTPLPNWRVDYTGLNKISALKDVFTSITITHAYSSIYSVSNFTNSLLYGKNGEVSNNISLSDYNTNSFATQFNSQGDIVPLYVISQVLISEQFSPLIGISVRTKSKLTARFEYKTKRDLSLNVSNSQITEVNARDWSIEIGFIKNNMRLPFRDQGRIITMKNDINFRLNLSVTDNRTIQRKIDDISTITNGNINIQIRPNVSYAVNNKLTVQMYVDRNINEPLVTNSYLRATTRVGAKILFNLSQ
ncbi:MAG: cell surface protein SprA [Cyclobacteriaceae bacterium]|nr:cell surface protein SprA [Cyclobacteriaceae bacterium]